jgi:DNA-binding IclR family transcriptional regulator
MVPSTSGVQVLDRAVLVLDAIARHGSCVLSDLVRETGLTRPTAHRLATALERHGLLRRDHDGRFALGGRLGAWAAVASGGLVERAQPVLAQLARRTGESAQLYMREGDHRVCVATFERPSGLRDTVPLGAVMPLTRGSGGKVLIAWAPDAARFDVAPAALAAVRRRGWADSVGERETGVGSVSAPVRDPGGAVIAAISVSGPLDRLGSHPGRKLGAAVVAAARELETGESSQGVIAG